MMHHYAPPKSDVEFERLCCEVFRVEWDRPGLQLYGKRGQAQLGVDIVDVTRPNDVLAIQCKCHEPTKQLPVSEIRDEVLKADVFSPRIVRYVFCTTAQKSRSTQDAVAELNVERAALGKFTVELVNWEDIEAIFDRNDLLREQVLQSSHASVARVIDDRIHSPAARRQLSVAIADGLRAEQNTQIDSEIDRAKRMLDENQIDAAGALLDDIKASKLDRLTPLQRYRLLTNLGVIAFRRGEPELAGRYLLEGVDAFPEHDLAAQHRAQGHALLDQKEASWRAAQDALLRDPRSATVAAIYIQCAPEELASEDLVRPISALSNHPEILSALAERMLWQGRIDDFRTVVGQLRAINDGPHTLFLEAVAQFAQYLEEEPCDTIVEPEHRQALNAAIPLLDRAFRAAVAEGDHILALRVTLTRVDAELRLDNEAGVEEALDLGRQVDFVPPLLGARLDLARAQLYLNRNHFDPAIRAAEASLKQHDDPAAHFLRAVALWERNGPGDRENARRELRRHAGNADGTLMEQIVSFLVRAEIWRERPEEAVEIVNSAMNLDSALANTLLAKIARSRNDESASLEVAKKGFATVRPTTSKSTRRMLAQVLWNAKLTPEAIATLEPLASRSTLTRDTHDLLAMAHTEARHDIFLAHAEPLFAVDALDEELRFAYLLLLADYDPTKALRLVREAINRAATEESRALLKVHEAVLLDASGGDVSVINPDDLPSAESVPLRYVGAVVHVLIRSPHGGLATDYAYRCVLRFPDEPAAHAALIRAGLFSPMRTDADLACTEVVVGTRVEYKEPGDHQARSVVMWETTIPGRSDFVIPDSPRGQRFQGKRIGDTVVLAEGATSQRVATITSIVLAWAHELRRSIVEWQVRFPDLPLLEQCRFETNPETGEPDVSPIIAMLKRFNEDVRHVDKVYQSGCAPIGMMSERLGRSIFETMGHLAVDDDLFINCVIGSDEAMNAAKSALDNAKHLVLDGTAIWTIVQLGLVDALHLLPIRVGTVQQSIDEMRRMAGKDEMGTTGHLSLQDDGRLVYSQTDTAQVGGGRAIWEKLLGLMLRDGVLSSEPLARLSKSSRESVISYAGEWTGHVLGAAATGGAVLWSDDRVIEFIGKEHLGVPRVWTQAVLAWLLDRNAITADRFYDATARLHAMRFSGMLVNAESVVHGAQLSGWQLGSRMFQRSLQPIGATTTRPGAAVAMALALLRSCARQVRLEVSRNHIVIAVVNQLLQRDPTGALARTLKRKLPGEMKLEPITAQAYQRTIELALRARMR